MSGVDDAVLDRVKAVLEEETLDRTPAELSSSAIRPVMDAAGAVDPFRDLKRRSNEAALELEPRLRDIIAGADDGVAMALRLSVVGNIVDLGIREDYDLEESLDRALSRGFTVDRTAELKAGLARARRLLYLCDNSGEILFDRLCIEILLEHHPDLDVTAVVNSGPVLNDATMEDAREVGLDRVCPVLETGYDLLGTLVEQLAEPVRRAFDAADIIISKGQANYETLDDRPENIYFILMAKCECVAEHLGVKLHDLVLTRGSGGRDPRSG